ncbi:MAG: response regulator [Planctomycetes bacterium]|nr:response regulator [Planctomycetota bacterium]
MKSLIVDDSEVIRRKIMKLLKEMGFECATASSSKEAKEILEKDMPLDLITVGFSLPDGTGLDLLRSIEDSIKTVPILIVASGSHKKRLVEALSLKIALIEFLPKPFEDEVFLEKVRNLMDRRSSSL